MKYGDENYQNRLKDTKLEPIYSFVEALLAAEAECERLRVLSAEARLITFSEINSLRIALEEYRARYGKLNHVEQEETK